MRHAKPRLATLCLFWTLVLAGGAVLLAQSMAGAGEPLIRIRDAQLSSPPVIISYGDMRFTDPKDTQVTNPKVRRWLVERIASEKPNVLLLGGDVPMHGGDADDYQVFRAETAAWKDAGIFLIPTLGNHELYLSDKQRWCKYDQPCLDNWWNTFPALRGVRWYAAQIGSRIMVLNIDSNLSLLPGSDQAKWIESQLATLPASVRVVFFNLHHPPVADTPATEISDASPRPNEAALAEFLDTCPEAKRVRFIVIAAHVHNYERFLRNGAVYLVSGGGGATPSGIQRGPDDLYQDTAFPNYHYLKFIFREDRVEAQMFRVSDPRSDAPRWDVKDSFEVKFLQADKP